MKKNSKSFLVRLREQICSQLNLGKDDEQELLFLQCFQYFELLGKEILYAVHPLLVLDQAETIQTKIDLAMDKVDRNKCRSIDFRSMVQGIRHLGYLDEKSAIKLSTKIFFERNGLIHSPGFASNVNYSLASLLEVLVETNKHVDKKDQFSDSDIKKLSSKATELRTYEQRLLSGRIIEAERKYKQLSAREIEKLLVDMARPGIKCPVCSQFAIEVWPDVDWDYDHETRESSPYIASLDYVCVVCGLSLDEDEAKDFEMTDGYEWLNGINIE